MWGESEIGEAGLIMKTFIEMTTKNKYIYHYGEMQA
jgi:hypothetical protein